MALKKITIEHTDGKVECITGEQLAKYTDNLQRTIAHAKLHGMELFKENPVVWHELAPEYKLQRVYFALIEDMAKNTGTGYTKTSLHAAMKPMLFMYIQDNPHYFKDNVVKHTTSALTHDGWVAFIEQLKEISQDVFGYVIE